MEEVNVFEKIKKLLNVVARRLPKDANFEKPSLTRSQALMLSFIAASPGKNVYQKDIEKKFSIRRSSASEQLKNLEKAGYITRKVDKADKRLKQIKLTKKSLSIREHFVKSIEECNREITRGIPKERIKEFCNIIDLMNENVTGGQHA